MFEICFEMTVVWMGNSSVRRAGVGSGGYGGYTAGVEPIESARQTGDRGRQVAVRPSAVHTWPHGGTWGKPYSIEAFLSTAQGWWQVVNSGNIAATTSFLEHLPQKTRLRRQPA